jgi:UDP-3-O-acyl-N-acetylglucosamine deacetylase
MRFEEAGVIEQSEGIEPLRIKEAHSLHDLPDNKSLSIEPSDTFEIEYTLEQPKPVGKQTLLFKANRQDFVKEIAPARTYGFLKDFERLERMGLGSGGRVNNLIILNDDGPINTTLRFEDEFVRHKVLDLMATCIF